MTHAPQTNFRHGCRSLDRACPSLLMVLVKSMNFLTLSKKVAGHIQQQRSCSMLSTPLAKMLLLLLLPLLVVLPSGVSATSSSVRAPLSELRFGAEQVGLPPIDNKGTVPADGQQRSINNSKGAITARGGRMRMVRPSVRQPSRWQWRTTQLPPSLTLCHLLVSCHFSCRQTR